jgi:hypothetical protein
MFIVVFATQVALDGELADLLTQAIHLAVREFLDLGRTLDADGVADFPGAGAADAVDRRQSDLRVLVIRDVDACYTSHVLTCSSPPNAGGGLAEKCETVIISDRVCSINLDAACGADRYR